MSDMARKLIDLINSEYTLNEITSLLNLSHDKVYELFRELKLIGIDFNKSYYYSGDIVYLPRKEIDGVNKANTVNILTRPSDEAFRAMVVSDLHAGSIYERIDVWNKIYDYCIINNIHIIIVCGDLVDGITKGRPECKKHNSSLEQFEHFIINYPYDKNILNMVTFGNHDVDSITSFGIDLSTFLTSFRHDIVPVGYGFGRINIKNDKIFVTHPLCIGVNKNFDLTSNYLLLKGHHHCAKSIIGTNGNCSLTVPSISDIFLTEDEFLPGAIDLNIKFKNGYFDTIYYEHLLIRDRVYAVSSTQFSVTPSKDRKYDGIIRHEDDLIKRRTLKKE